MSVERFSKEIKMWGRWLRIDENDDVFVLSRRHQYEHWHKLSFRVERYSKCGKTMNRGLVSQCAAHADRYNQEEMPRAANGDYPPRMISYSVLLAIKYLSNGVDLGYKDYFVIHKNGDVLDNSIDNLQWVTKDYFFNEKVKKTVPVGTKIGLWTVRGVNDIVSSNCQREKPFIKTFVNVECQCGTKSVIDLTQLKRGNSKICCDYCREEYGKNTVSEVLQRFGLMKIVGVAKNGRKNKQLVVMPPDYDLTPVLSELNSCVRRKGFRTPR